MKRLILTLCLILLLSAGCASHGFVPAVSYDIRGSIRDNHYTSPSGNFRIRVPPLLKPGAKIWDWTTASEVWGVAFIDDMCRGYSVAEKPGDLQGLSIEMWVDQSLLSQDNSQISLLERKTVQTRYGPTVFLRYRQPETAPCYQIQMKEGKRIKTKPDVEKGEYILFKDGYFYRLVYAVGVNPEGDAVFSWGGGPPKVENKLSRFVEGFEILRTTQK